MRKFKNVIVPVVMSVAMVAFGLTAGAENIETTSDAAEPPVAAVGMGAPVMAGNPGDAENDTTEDLDAEIWYADDEIPDGDTIENPELDGGGPLNAAAPDGDTEEPVAVGMEMENEAVDEVVLDAENGEPEEAKGAAQAKYAAKGANNDGAAVETMALNGAEKNNNTVYYICGAALVVLAAFTVVYFAKKKKK